MYKIVAFVCGLFLFSTAASAQRLNAFVGYSYITGFGPNLGTLQLDPLSPRIIHRLNDWNASLEAKVLTVLGIVADFSGHYGNATTYLSWFEPYAQALFGGALVTYETSFGYVLGGRINVSVIPRLAWRVQADVMQTLSDYLLNNSLRLSTGLVFRF